MQYGVNGFCVYHYWFEGKKLLNEPYERMLIDGEPDLPFCFCWANENWTRKWDGLAHNILQPQTYGGAEEWEAHLRYLLPFFKHKNYIRVGGCPMFVVYRPGKVANEAERWQYYRKFVLDQGFPGIHLVQVMNPFEDIISKHVDATCDLAPFIPNGHPSYRCVCPGWDNTPRLGKTGLIIKTSTPTQFGREVKEAVSRTGDFLFVNAWNEWGEQAVLEPDEEFGYGYLQALRDALE